MVPPAAAAPAASLDPVCIPAEERRRPLAPLPEAVGVPDDSSLWDPAILAAFGLDDIDLDLGAEGFALNSNELAAYSAAHTEAPSAPPAVDGIPRLPDFAQVARPLSVGAGVGTLPGRSG